MSDRVTIGIPEWAIEALVYDDYSGLSDSECALIRGWMREESVCVVCPPNDYDEPYFSNEPAFGLPCEVLNCVCLIGEREYRVVIREGGFPTSVYYMGSMEECEVMVDAWRIRNKRAPDYVCPVIEPVRYDEDGRPTSFASERDEYYHCWMMGDFDY